MKPILKLNGVDFTKHLLRDGIKPSLNDLDSDGSGRNLLNGLMYRKRIATKGKWTISFKRLDETVMKELMSTLYSSGDYIKVTMLDASANKHITKSCYFSTINQGVQLYRGGHTVYDGVTFNITER